MADAITIKALQDASLDAKSLEEVVNGDDTKQVTTRLGENYPSVKKAIKTMFENGGFPAAVFDSKPKMLTEGAVLADGDYAWVTDDTDANNGLYIKRSGAWVFSEFNVLKRVQDYVKRLDEKVMLDSGSYLDIATDDMGEVYRYTDVDGGLYVKGLNNTGSVQENINNILGQSHNSGELNTDELLLVNADLTGEIYSYYDEKGNLNTKGSFIDGLDDIKANRKTRENWSRYQNTLMHKYPKVKDLVTVSQGAANNTKRMPFGITTKTGVVLFHSVQTTGGNGDSTHAQMWKTLVTINEDLSTTIVSDELFLAPDEARGIVKHPMLCRTSDNRILLVFEKRLESTESYTQYSCYSSDEGLTFTIPVALTISGVLPETTTALGSTGTITVMPSGRLILPFYNGFKNCYCLFSDNDGLSWVLGGMTPNDTGQEPSVSLDINNNLMMTVRPLTAATVRVRDMYKSYDSGLTWEKFTGQGLISATNQGVLFRDESIGAIVLGYNNIGSTRRTHYTLSISYDNGRTYPFSYMPFNKDWYGGYSQILKWKDGVYLIIIEFEDTYTTHNYKESSAILILTLNEVLSNVTNS